MNKEAVEEYVVINLIRDEANRDTIYEIQGEYFGNNIYRGIFEKVSDMHKDRKVIDLISVAEECNLDLECLVNMANKNDGLFFDTHLNDLKMYHHKLNVIKQCQLVIKELSNKRIENISDINSILHKIEPVQQKEGDRYKNLYEIFFENVNEYQKYLENPHKLLYDIKYLDALTDGIHKSELTVLAARPGQGKTAVAINMAINVAAQGKHVVIFSLEMSRNDVVDRIISNINNLNSNVIRSKDFNEQQELVYLHTGDKLKQLNIRIEDNIYEAEEIVAKIYEINKKKPIDYIVIDYIGLMETRKNFVNRQEQVQYTTRLLKKTIQDTQIPFLLLAQLNRNIEARADKRPILSDLRDSGSLEQDANNVIMLYTEDENATPYVKLEIILRKQRNGMTGTAKVKYYKNVHKIYDN